VLEAEEIACFRDNNDDYYNHYYYYDNDDHHYNYHYDDDHPKAYHNEHHSFASYVARQPLRGPPAARVRRDEE
jgi:hypothetical protein